MRTPLNTELYWLQGNTSVIRFPEELMSSLGSEERMGVTQLKNEEQETCSNYPSFAGNG
jgi:hypothetical protein